MRAPLRPHHALALACACGPGAPDETTGASAASTSSATSAASTADASTSTTDSTSTPPTTSSTTSSTSTTSTTAEPTTLAPGTTGAVDPAICAAAAMIALKDPTATPDMPPGWGPGESVTIGVTLHNTGAEDFNVYPGIHVTADHPGVTSAMPANWLFAIFAGMESELAVTFTAAADVPAPGTVTFSVRLDILNEPCPDLPKLEFTVPVE